METSSLRSIEPVPTGDRALGTLDTALLWGNLGVSLLVLVAGTYLVPALSLPDALVAIVLGCVIGNLMVAVAAAIGAQAGVPAMVLMRAPLGRRGSLLPTGLNIAQCLGWTVFELIVIATAASALSARVFGIEATALWTIVFAALALVLGLLGPVGVVRRVLRTVAVWAVPLALAYLAWWTFTGADIGSAWQAPGEGGLTIWQGADLVIGITVSWIPLAADYTRFSKGPRPAFVGAGVGYLVPDVLLLGLGATLFFSRGLSDPAELPTAVAASGLTAFVALLALTIAETDEAFANAYSGAVSIQNILPKAPQQLLVVLTTGVSAVGALVLDLTSFEPFLLLLGSFFVPLFAVLLADWLFAGRAYERRHFHEGPRWRLPGIAAWIGGFALYQWLNPTGPSWWTDLVAEHAAPAFGVGATMPAFACSFALMAVGTVISRRVSGAIEPA